MKSTMSSPSIDPRGCFGIRQKVNLPPNPKEDLAPEIKEAEETPVEGGLPGEIEESLDDENTRGAANPEESKPASPEKIEEAIEAVAKEKPAEETPVFKCEICGKEFKTQHALNGHLRLKHNIKK